jgi:hypothetical protein
MNGRAVAPGSMPRFRVLCCLKNGCEFLRISAPPDHGAALVLTPSGVGPVVPLGISARRRLGPIDSQRNPSPVPPIRTPWQAQLQTGLDVTWIS